MIELNLVGVRVELPSNTPIVLLKERDGDRFLPIFIGAVEATAIAFALQGVVTQRPMTHDLMKDLLVSLEVSVDSVVVTQLVDGIFYAEIRMTHNGRRCVVSSRPSDAMALAVRLGTPIFAEDALLETEGVVLQDDGDQQQQEILDEFHRFIQDVRPEDFAS